MAQASIHSMQELIPLAIRCQDDQIEAMRIAKEWRNLSFKTLDELGGFTQGHMERVIGPRREKGMSPFVFQMLCSLLAVKFVMVPDDEQAARMAAKWERRDLSNVRLETGRVSKHILERARPNLLQEFGEKLALAFGDDVDQLVAGITAKRSDHAPAPNVESAVAILALPPPPAESPQPAKVEALKPSRPASPLRAHLHVIQPRTKGARWGGAL
jgi:hypothetical protein